MTTLDSPAMGFNTPFVSVTIPTHDGEQVLSSTIEMALDNPDSRRSALS